MHKKPDRVIRVGLWCMPCEGLGRELLRVLRFTQVPKEGFVEWLADIHAGSDQFVEDRRDAGDDPAGLGFPEHCQTSKNRDALAERFPSGFALINKEGRSLLFGQRDRFTLSEVEFRGQLINERAVPHGTTLNPGSSLHLCGSRFPGTPDHDILIDGIGNGEVADDLMKELQSGGA